MPIRKQSTVRVGGTHTENRLQQARIKAGVSQETVAEWLSCDTRTIQRYEAGEHDPTLSQLILLRNKFQCEISDFFPADTSFPPKERDDT